MRRDWKDIARKLIAFALGSLSATAIIAIGAAFGVEIPTGLAAFLASAVGIVAGYFTTEAAPAASAAPAEGEPKHLADS